MKRAFGLLAIAAVLLAGAPAFAHHATQAEFDQNNVKTITGVMTKVMWVNPHVNWHIDVKNPDGTTTDWTFTTGSATALAERGISKVGPNALKIGEQVTATFTPARNGAPLGGLKTLKRADGSVIAPPAN